jgi:hypothetical protein
LLTQADDAATRTTLGLGTAATTAATAYDVAGAAALMLPLAGGTMTGAIVGNKAAGAKFAILPLADSTTAFQVQTAAGANILNVNSTGSAVGIGTTTTSTVSKLIVGPYVTADVLANVHITAIAATHKPLVVQGFTAQTGNLQEWQSSAGTVLASVSSAGLGTFAGVTATALVLTAATATGGAGFRMPHGTAPTTPVDGDLWTTTAGMFVRINGVTKTVTLT